MARALGYGQPTIDAIYRLRAEFVTGSKHWREANNAIIWLENSLSEAARDGCRHCDETPKGEPCRWCGLVYLR